MSLPRPTRHLALLLICGLLSCGLLPWLARPASARELPAPVAWAVDLPGSYQAQPLALDHERVVVLAGDRVLCLSAKDGSTLWKADLPATGYSSELTRLSHTPAALLVPGGGGRPPCALDPASGRVLWTGAGDGGWLAGNRYWVEDQSPAAGVVCQLVGLNPSTGQEEARVPFSGGLNDVAVGSDYLLVATGAGRGRLDPYRAVMVYLDPEPAAQCAAHPGADCFRTLGGDLVGLGPEGTRHWSRTGVGDVEVVSGWLLTLDGAKARMSALQSSTGKAIWTRKVAGSGLRMLPGGEGLGLLQSEWQGAELFSLDSGRTLLRRDALGPCRLLDGTRWMVGPGGVLLGLDPAGRVRQKLGRVLLDVESGSLTTPEPLKVGPRVLLGAGSTLAALGPGSGLLRRTSNPELNLEANLVQAPSRLRCSLQARFVRRAHLEVQAPDGRQLVARELDLAAGSGGSYRSLDFPAATCGTYRVTVRSSGREASASIQVTDLAILARVWPGRLLCQVQGLREGGPLAGVRLRARDPESGQTVAEGHSDAQGEVSLELPSGPPELELEASLGPRLLRQKVRNPPTSADVVHLSTDRPLYRPGHKVFFKGVTMKTTSSGLELAPGETIQVEARDSADAPLFKQSFTSDAFGSFSGEFALGPEAPLGRYVLVARGGASEADQRLPFVVQEYRKPPFEVTVRPRESLGLAGQPLHFEVKAAYFFGGPVASGSVRYKLSSTELWGEPGADPEDAPPGEAPYRGYGRFVKEDTVELGPDGTVVITADTLGSHQDANYDLDVTVLGPEGREVDGFSRVPVGAARFGVYLRPASWVVTAGQSWPVQIRTVDRLGRPFPTEVEVQALCWGWTGRRYEQVPVSRATTRTDASGRGQVSLHFEKPGYYTLEASARDSGGRSVRDSTWLYATGSGDFYWSGQSLSLIPDRTRARPGQSIRCLILSSRPGTVWFTVEGSQVYLRRSLRVERKPVVVDVPVQSEFVPEVTLRAVMPGPDTLGQEEVTVRVPSSEHELTVEVAPDRTDYRPAGEARLKLRTSYQGRPVRSSLSLAVVDEALLALQPEFTPPIWRYFYAHRASHVESYDRVPGLDWVAGFQTVNPPVPVRENFQDTALWKADVVTDEQGQTEVAFALPDNLTRWRATARAAAPPAEVGQQTASLITRLPLMVQTLAPRFAVQGDQMAVKSQVMNRTDAALTAAVQLQCQGARALTAGRQELAIPSQGQDSMVTRVEVDSTSEVTLESRASGGGEADAERIHLPVKPFGERQEAHDAGLVTEPREWEFQVPEGALLPRLSLRYTPDAAGVVAGALGYLVDYPYGCVEQTMSRFGPTLAASRAMRELGLAAPVAPAELQRIVSASLDKLYGYQHEDGGWGWWTSDPTHPYMTGYVVAGLARAQQDGWTVQPDVLERGIQAARNLMEAAADPDQRAYLAWALSLAGQPPREQLAQLAALPNLSRYSQALVAQALLRSGLKAEAAPLLAGLRSQAVREGGGAHWEASALTPHGWTDDDLEATCLTLSALLQDNPDDPLLGEGLKWLLSRRRGSQWQSTRDTAQAVLLLSGYLAARPPAPTQGRLLARLDGRELNLPAPTASGEGTLLVEGDSLPSGRHVLRLEPAGGVPIVAAQAAWYQPPASAVMLAQEHGLKVERRLHREGQRGPLTGPLAPQERLEVELAITVPRAMEYVILEDPRAAGTEPISEQSSYWVEREDRDDRSVFFFTYLPQGTTRIAYKVRAETPGDYRALPARAWLMYQPEVSGSSDSARVEIGP